MIRPVQNSVSFYGIRLKDKQTESTLEKIMNTPGKEFIFSEGLERLEKTSGDRLVILSLSPVETPSKISCVSAKLENIEGKILAYSNLYPKFSTARSNGFINLNIGLKNLLNNQNNVKQR